MTSYIRLTTRPYVAEGFEAAFRCPECAGVKWRALPQLDCCGTDEAPHRKTAMIQIDEVGAPGDTPGLRTGGDCLD